jgi:beta-phosphoglucomutase-like phosphatase (HAD superfamily)
MSTPHEVKVGNHSVRESPSIKERTGPRDSIVNRDEVSRAKPDPDLFIAAAERLAVAIESSVVVSDSVWDLLAARRARALGVDLLSGGYGQEELERAGAWVSASPGSSAADP